jgi:LmbE family N-acetylglucosaminyl deacetylase
VRILGLFPHPDDESYAAGAALAQCAAAGCDVRVVSATRGEAGRVQSGGNLPPEQVARIRSAELQAACRALGVTLESFLDLPDGRLAEVPAATFESAIAAVLGRLAPDVVLSLGGDGVYGSHDHLALTARLRAVAPRFPATAVLWAAFPEDHFAPLRRKLDRAGIAVDTALPLGARRTDVAVCVTVSEPQRRRKLAAVGAHRSQLRDGDPHSFLGGGLLEPLLGEEWFTTI